MLGNSGDWSRLSDAGLQQREKCTRELIPHARDMEHACRVKYMVIGGLSNGGIMDAGEENPSRSTLGPSPFPGLAYIHRRAPVVQDSS